MKSRHHGHGRNEYEWLVGGLVAIFWIFPYDLGMSSSQLTFIFFRGVQTTNQMNNALFRLFSATNHHGHPAFLFVKILSIFKWNENAMFSQQIPCDPYVHLISMFSHMELSGKIEVSPNHRFSYMEVSKNRGTQKWMVNKGKSQSLKWMITGGSPVSGNPHLFPNQTIQGAWGYWATPIFRAGNPQSFPLSRSLVGGLVAIFFPIYWE